MHLLYREQKTYQDFVEEQFIFPKNTFLKQHRSARLGLTVCWLTEDDFQVLPSRDTTDIDYTKLSIGDIMYIRGIMATTEGEKRKRKKTRKIIVS